MISRLLRRPVVLKLTNSKDQGIQRVIADLPLPVWRAHGYWGLTP